MSWLDKRKERRRGGERTPTFPNLLSREQCRNGDDPAGTESAPVELHDESDITRRDFVKTTAVVSGCALLNTPALGPIASLTETALGTEKKMTVSFAVNGVQRHLLIDPRTTLLDVLRENQALTGAKKGCDRGQCGACTVLANGRSVNSCLAFAAMFEGKEITTIEGLARGDELHPVQRAFLENDGFQCGYCTPGQICSAVAAIQEAARGEASLRTLRLSVGKPIDLTSEEIRERMSGNICRCGAYPNIVAAVQAAEQTMKNQ